MKNRNKLLLSPNLLHIQYTNDFFLHLALDRSRRTVGYVGNHMTEAFAPITVDVTPREACVARPSFKISRCSLIGRMGACDQRSREVLCHARDRKRIVLNSFKLCCKH